LGIHIAKQRPDLFYAYVGTGQISNMPKSLQMSYAYVLDKAQKANDAKAVKALQNIGPPPFDTMDKIAAFFQTFGKYECQSDQNLPVRALVEPDLSLWDIYNSIRGFVTVPTFRVYNQMLSADVPSFTTDFQIPIFFFQGELDERAQPSLAKEYFDHINAPHKEFVLFDGAGHFAVWTMSNRFLRELVARVRPLATQPGGEQIR
jgi:pimeloyl-ACP methyl ester carboxylesterase